jgi:arylsulfatase A-like enzyme
MTHRLVMREGDYKLIGIGDQEFGLPTKYELYNVATDPEESHNLASEKPELLKSMIDKAVEMHKRVNADRKKTREAIEAKKTSFGFE